MHGETPRRSILPRSILGRTLAAFFTLLPAVLFGNLVPHDAAAQTAASPVAGFPRTVAWVMLAGGIQSNIDDDAATWRAQIAAGVDPNLVTLVYPYTQDPHPAPPADAAASTLHVKAANLPELFDLPGKITHRLHKHVTERPDLVLLDLATPGAADGSFQWGTEKLTLEELETLLARLHAAYRVPVVLIADRGHADGVRLILERFKSETWRQDTYIITASPSSQSAVPFAAPPGSPDQIKSVFRDDKVYWPLTANLLAGRLGAAEDRDHDGLDAADLCELLQKREPSVVCDGGVQRDPDPSKWTARFAFTIPAVTVDLDVAEPAFHATNGAVPFPEVVAAFAGALQTRATELHGAYRLLLHRCKDSREVDAGGRDLGKACSSDWACSAGWEQARGYQAQCLDRRRNRVVPSTATPSIDDLKPGLARIARRVLPGPGGARSGLTVDPPRPEGRDTSLTYGVLLDRSKSMIDNDPGNRKRRLFFDSVIRPALVENRAARLLVASFASDVRVTQCFERGGDVDQARRCYLREATADGSTNLLGAMNSLVEKLGPNDVVWLVSDGAHSEWIDDCPDAHVGVPSLNLCEGASCTSATPRYQACQDQKIIAAGKRLAADHRSVFVVFLDGQAHNKDVLHQLAQASGGAAANFVALANGEDERAQARRLFDLGLTKIQQSVATLPPLRHNCPVPVVPVQCKDTFEFDVGPTSSAVQVYWNNLIAEDQHVYLKPAGLSLAPRNPTAVDDKGVSVRLTVTDAVTTLSWSTPKGQDLPKAKWTVELEYQVTGAEK